MPPCDGSNEMHGRLQTVQTEVRYATWSGFATNIPQQGTAHSVEEGKAAS